MNTKARLVIVGIIAVPLLALVAFVVLWVIGFTLWLLLSVLFGIFG